MALDESGAETVLDLIREHKVDLVINIPKNATDHELRNDYMIRRAAGEPPRAADHQLITNIQLA